MAGNSAVTPKVMLFIGHEWPPSLNLISLKTMWSLFGPTNGAFDYQGISNSRVFSQFANPHLSRKSTPNLSSSFDRTMRDVNCESSFEFKMSASKPRGIEEFICHVWSSEKSLGSLYRTWLHEVRALQPPCCLFCSIHVTVLAVTVRQDVVSGHLIIVPRAWHSSATQIALWIRDWIAHWRQRLH